MTEPTSPAPTDENRRLADASAPGWRLEHVATTASTNALAAERPEPGRVVVTDHQTAGRGRLDRGWETPARVALTFSAVVDPGVPERRWPWLPLLTGVAVASAVRRTTGLEVTLKWPNDVLVEERKLAGILVERVPSALGAVAVLGIGINVHQTSPPVAGATSLALEGSPAERAYLLEAVLERLAAELGDWRSRSGEPTRLRPAYAQMCSTVGQQVTVHLPGERTVTGRAEAIDEQGRLEVDVAGGERITVGAGDVIHVRARPADR